MGNCFSNEIDIVKIAKVHPKIAGRQESFEKIQIRCSENHNKKSKKYTNDYFKITKL